MTETASTFLARAQGQTVLVQLRDRALRGKLAGWESFINLQSEKAEEIAPSGTRKLGQVVIRGSQVTVIHATKLGPPVVEPRRETAWSGTRSDRAGYCPSRRDTGDRGWARRRE